MKRKTIPEAQKLLAQLTQAISQDSSTGRWRDSEGVPESVVDIILELDSILSLCYTNLSDFLKPQGKTESDHTVAKLLGQCCCAYWRARRIRGMGDF